MDRNLPHLLRGVALVGAVIASLSAGCSLLPAKKVPRDAAAGFYESASLTYRLDAGALQQPLDVLHVENQQVSYEQVASSPLPEQTIGTLIVTYPHPSGRPGVAEARFTLDSASAHGDASAKSSSWNPFQQKKPTTNSSPSVGGAQPEVHESWVMDIPSAESDQLFKLLASQGFYQMQRPNAVGVQLAAKINGSEVRKNWEPVPELNALVRRVRHQGQLVAYSRPSTAAPGKPISSTRAYSDLLAHITNPGGPAAPVASIAASPFSMNPPPAQAPVGPPVQQAVGIATIPTGPVR